MSAQMKGVQIRDCIEQLVAEMIKQVKTNKIDRVIKHDMFDFFPGITLQAVPGYKLLGPHQVIPWAKPQFKENPNAIITGFKIKLMGECMSRVNVTAGMILPDLHGESHKENLINIIESNIKERFAKNREQSMH